MTATFRNQIYLGLAQLCAHLSVVYIFWNFDSRFGLGMLVMYFLMTGWGVSLIAHRYLSHRSYEAPPWFWRLGSLFFTLSMQGSTLAWVAMHRQHHRYADQSRDPHCPRHGFWRVHFLSMFYTPSLRYVIDLMRISFHQRIHRHYWAINLAFSAALWSAFGWKGVIYLHWAPAALCWQGISVAKTLAHMYGYRNFKTGDDSRNIPILGYLTFGEAWHNNHHASPEALSFRVRWHEFDLSYVFLRACAMLFGFKIISRAQTRLKSIETFTPPKPKLFLRT
ncbi:MAG TPA: acyl-CoA desaturase [Bdellovibrionales bacterium]|nr:acyl-CoA desaturase [Bdellovibrionales bacterium]